MHFELLYDIEEGFYKNIRDSVDGMERERVTEATPFHSEIQSISALSGGGLSSPHKQKPGNTQDLHIANGVGWYFNDDSVFSWGFVRPGDGVRKENCDIAVTGANDERLC